MKDQCFPFSQFAIAEVLKKFQKLQEVLKKLLKIAEIENSAIANCENGKHCEGWSNISNGSLLSFPDGEPHDWHATLLEGYDFKNKAYICKNSWGGTNCEPRFLCRLSALHGYDFVKVFWTVDSIKGKTTGNYVENLYKCTQTIDDITINAAWMDKATAIYNSDFVCEYNENGTKINPSFTYLGYDIDEWINIITKKEIIDVNHF